MKKALKILGIIIAVILLLLAAGAVALQSPRIQKAVAEKLIDRFGGFIKGNVTFDGIAIKPFNALVIENVLITEENPRDTFFSASWISARFSLKGLLKKEGLHFDDVHVKDGVMNLVVEPSDSLRQRKKGQTNLERVFNMTDSRKKSGKTPGDIFDIKKVQLDNFTFRMINLPAWERHSNMGHRIPSGSIDWDDMEIVADIRGHDMAMSGKVMTAVADRITLRERSGLVIDNISGKVSAGGGKTVIEDLRIQNEDTDIDIPLFQMLYGNQKNFNKFVNNVRIVADIRESIVDFKTIGYFAPALKNKPFRAKIQGKVDGPVQEFGLNSLHFQDLGSGVSGNIGLKMNDVLHFNDMDLDFSLSDFRFTTASLGKFIKEWAPGAKIDIGHLAPGETFIFNGTGSGKLDNLSIKGTLKDRNSGTCGVDIRLKDLVSKESPLRINGGIRTDSFDLGRFALPGKLGKVTARIHADAVLGEGQPKVRIDSAIVSRLNLFGYDYTGIKATGTYSGNAFDGRIVCHDPNLDFMFQGLFNLSGKTQNAAYQFYANIGYADLHALNLDSREVSKVSVHTNANFIRMGRGDMIGDINIADLVFENSLGPHNIGDISVKSHSNDQIHRIRFNSEFAEGTYLSSESLGSTIKYAKSITIDKELPSLQKSSREASAEAPKPSSAELNFIFRDSRDLFSFIKPGVYIAENTTLRMKLSEEGNLEGVIASPRLAFKDKYIKDMAMSLGNKNGGLSADIAGSEIKISSIQLLNSTLMMLADDDHLGLGFAYDNETDDINKGEIYLTADLSRDSSDSLVVVGKALPSNIYINGDGWGLTSGDIVFKHGDISVGSLLAASDEQTLSIDGGFSPSKRDTLTVDLSKFDISAFNAFLKQDLALKGQATGKAMLTSPSKPSPGILVSISCDSTEIASHKAGLVNISSNWNEEHRRFDVNVSNLLEGKTDFDIGGWFNPSDKSLSLSADLEGMELGYAAPMVKSIFSRMEGDLHGKVMASGTFDRLSVASEGLMLSDGLLEIAFTKVPYHLSGPVSISDRGLSFNGVTIRDSHEGRGNVSGGISWNRFKDMSLGLGIQFDRMLCLNLGESDNPSFYGNVTGTGGINISGPFNDIVLDIEATTAGGGNLHIPLGNSSISRNHKFLTFYEPPKEIVLDPYELMMDNYVYSVKKPSDLDVKLRVNATPEVTVYVEIDKSSGNILSGNGNGRIEIESRSSNNLFTINGSYNLTGGNYHLSALNLANRDFTLKEDSSIRFNGDIMDSDLDIKGLYTTKASLSNLIPEVTVRRNVECGINITDKLSNPRINLTIDVPDLDPATHAQVESALNSEDKIQKQFIYLLIANQFLPQDESGVVNDSNLLYSNVSSIMSNQLNTIFQKLDIPVDLGLTYESSEHYNDIFDVAVSTQLFNNRVIVNGTIGNRQYSRGTQNQDVVGDLDIEIKLNRTGTFRLNLFSHSVDQYTNYLDNSQRNGAGITWQKEFNSLSRKKENPLNTGNDVILNIGEDGKTIATPDEEDER